MHRGSEFRTLRRDGDPTRPIRDIVIVGGGTSGWMSATYLRRAYPDVHITVLEAPSIPRIGVGEATIPNLDSAFWQFLGIPESEWMPRVRATCKMGIKFANWAAPKTCDPDDHYWHLFGVMPAVDGVPLPHYWNQHRLQGGDAGRFDQQCYQEAPVAEQQRSPVDLDGTKWSNYAWHFDSNLMAEYLKEQALSWGVQLVPEMVVDAAVDSDGQITSVTTEHGHDIGGDFFVDCTGFRSLLIGQSLGEEFVDASDQLLCNAAVATQLPHDDDDAPVDAYTTATALDNGWSWHIPLLGRIGAGYVYSDRHCTEDEAIAEFSEHLGIDPDDHTWNKLRFPVGRRRRAWVGNCVAVGLSGNFLEPLESTALYLTYGALHQLVAHLPDADLGRADRVGFNEALAYSYDDCKDFVQMHYVCSPRRDTRFWQDNHQLNVAPTLQEKLDRYRDGLVINLTTTNADAYYNNFDYEFRNFWTEGSYYAVLTGMGVYPERVHESLRGTGDSAAVEQLFTAVKERGALGAEQLPSHREFLVSLYHDQDGPVIDLRDRD